MTDAELMRLAAKAAGYWSAEYNCPDKLPRAAWDPLADDGDALRLAARLSILIEPGPVYAYGIGKDFCAEEGPIEPADEAGMLAATRRAIVRAAAAMAGKE